MKKYFMFLLVALVVFPAIVVFNGCSIGVCTLTFETWGGTGPSDIVLSPGESLDSSKFYDAQKPGYDFVCWCYDEELTRPISFPMVATNGVFTYYAKYELDEEYFISNSNYITWTNDQEDIYADASLNPYTQLNFMLEKSNLNFVLESIEIEPIDPTPGQGFMVDWFEVYDEQGKIVDDADFENKYIFVPKEEKDENETYYYVLRVTASVKGGDFRIKINGKTSE